MQLSFTTATALVLTNLPILINAHMMFAHNSVWGFKSVGGGLETPLNRQSGGNWLHHGQRKDNDNFLELTPGGSKSLDIVCGEAAKNPGQASSKCKTRAGECLFFFVFTFFLFLSIYSLTYPLSSRRAHGRWLRTCNRIQGSFPKARKKRLQSHQCRARLPHPQPIQTLFQNALKSPRL